MQQTPSWRRRLHIPSSTNNVNEQKTCNELSADARTATLPQRRDKLRLLEAVQTDDRGLI
jgi:hypothetical protein